MTMKEPNCHQEKVAMSVLSIRPHFENLELQINGSKSDNSCQLFVVYICIHMQIDAGYMHVRFPVEYRTK